MEGDSFLSHKEWPRPHEKLYVAVVLILTARCYAEPCRIALVTDDNTNIFWKYVYSGAARARDDLKAEGVAVNLSWDGPVNDMDASLERRILEQKIAEKVDGIVLSPANVRTLVEPVSAAARAGIATVVINAGLGTAGQISFVSTDNYQGVRTLVAHFQGKPVEKEIDTGCRIVTVGNLATPEIQEILRPPAGS